MEQVYTVHQRNESNLPHKKFIYENKTHFKSTMPELYTNARKLHKYNASLMW